jgi:hypothetical protein
MNYSSVGCNANGVAGVLLISISFSAGFATLQTVLLRRVPLLLLSLFVRSLRPKPPSTPTWAFSRSPSNDELASFSLSSDHAIRLGPVV